MNIGIDYTSAIHQLAGIGRYTRELVKALSQHSELLPLPHYRLFVAGANDTPREALGPHFTWHRTALSKRWLERLWYRLRLPLWIEGWTGPLDLFHQPDFVLPPVKAKTPTIVTIHDLSFVREPDSVMTGMSRHLNKWVPWSVNKATHVIAVSEATRQDLIELYQTPPEKITTIYHGVTPHFAPVTDPAQLEAVRQKYGLGAAPFILSVGTIQPRKNYQRLIQAFAQLPTGEHNLVLAGGMGWQAEEILAEARKPALKNRVLLPGFIADEDLPALFSAADLFAYPSLYEGFGLPVLEAMACGTPVVCSNNSSLPEVAGEAGLQVDPLDVQAITATMADVLVSNSLHEEMSAKGRKQAAKFTWRQAVKDLMGLYQRLLEKR